MRLPTSNPLNTVDFLVLWKPYKALRKLFVSRQLRQRIFNAFNKVSWETNGQKFFLKLLSLARELEEAKGKLRFFSFDENTSMWSKQA